MVSSIRIKNTGVRPDFEERSWVRFYAFEFELAIKWQIECRSMLLKEDKV